MSYIFKYKKENSLFWKSKKVIGHGMDFYIKETLNSNNQIIQKTKESVNAMILYYEDGSVERIPNWDKYRLKLSTDWKVSIQNQMGKETGQEVKLNL